MKCAVCRARILSEREMEQLLDWIDADMSIDAGEWSGQHDYFADVCTCELEREEMDQMCLPV